MIKCDKLKFYTLNVGGLKGKLISEDFEEEIESFDIVCLLEIKMDKNDISVIEKEFDQFKIFTNVEEDYQVNPRGGIMILVKNYICENIKLIPKINNLALSIEINSKILKIPENVILTAVYLPPSGSAYSGEEDFELLDILINNLQQNYKNIILTGDFNSKTRELSDFIIVNENDALYQLGVFDQKFIKTARKNQDLHEADQFGHKLLNLCKIHNLQILNGRVGKDEGVGKYTTKNNSVIDYVLAPPDLFVEIKDFEIQDFNPLMSDVHCPIIFSLLSKTKNNISSITNKAIKKIKWDVSKNSDFVENIDSGELENLHTMLQNFSPSGNSENSEIELFVNLTNEILCKAREKTFETKTVVYPLTKKKAWYDKVLTRAKNKFHSARKQKNRKNIRTTSKIYKSLLNSKFKIFDEKRRKKIRENKVKIQKFIGT